ncbi:LacI family DNA-binding transcriptional regulator [Sphingomonas sp. DT-51]|uniref:LacI family DNA-binding transcriptional regulator n=1 Tax=Sphingomonas sp. DT-51 TaxID=3396165 RepID=UPI003F1D1F5C
MAGSKSAGEGPGAEEAEGFDRPSRRATSYDVAKRAGVSQSAVSRCFAPNGSISATTRDRIMKAATELGYRPNALAQGLISRRTHLVAVIMSSLTMLHYPEVLSELSHRLTERDLRMLLFSLEAESDVDGVLEQVLRHSVDGVICAAHLTDDQIERFAAQRVPLVLYNRLSGRAPATSVACDSVAGQRDLVERLLAAGHRRFAVVAGPADSYVGEERRRAALARLGEAGITDVPQKRGDFGYASGGEAMDALMAEAGRLDAVVCVNDLMAIGAIDVARERFGLRIPEDLSVVGFDGTDPASWGSYRLCSIRQPVRRMTQAAVDMLLERVVDPRIPTERRLFSGRFMEGRSARLA